MDNDSKNTPKPLVEHDQVMKAVLALLSYMEKKNDKKQLLKESEKVWLQFAFKKIPKLKNKAIKLPLPHSVASDSSSVCLFVKDLDRKDREYEKSVHHFKEYLESKGVNVITDIIPLKSLRLEYKPFEAKRNLSNMYDIYLADDRIIRFLPSLLGKAFYGRKRKPVQVDLTAHDLKKEINRAISGSRCMIGGRGSVSNCFVATTNMQPTEMADNICMAVEKIASSIPGGAGNVRNFYIKSENSLAIPIYISLGSADEVVLPKSERKRENLEPEEISTLLDEKVLISRKGTVRVVKPQSIHKRKQKEKTKRNRNKSSSRGVKAKSKKLKKSASVKGTSGVVKKKTNKKKKRIVAH